jgi:flagellin-like protein
MFFRNVGRLSADHTALYPSRQNSTVNEFMKCLNESSETCSSCSSIGSTVVAVVMVVVLVYRV